MSGGLYYGHIVPPHPKINSNPHQFHTTYATCLIRTNLRMIIFLLCLTQKCKLKKTHRPTPCLSAHCSNVLRLITHAPATGLGVRQEVPPGRLSGATLGSDQGVGGELRF